MARATRPLRPILTEQRATAALLAAAALELLVIPPFVADGQRILFWSDLGLVAFAGLAVVWLRRQRKHLVTAAPAPDTAVLSSDRRVLGWQAVWAVPYLLFGLAAAISNPDFFGMGFAGAVVAVALAREARYVARWQQRTGVRLYRNRERGWFKRDKIYRVS